MKRNTALKILNPILAALVLYQALTGIFRALIPLAVFEVIHPAGGIALALVAATHLSLNWNWVKANYRRGNPAAQP